MAGMLRKFASAFVVLDESKGDDSQHPDIEEITKEAPSLLAQLEGAPVPSADPQAVDGGAVSSAMSMTADQVFQSQGLVDGPNAAPRLLKLIAGLSMFPREHQLTMVRAMDAADDSWSEQGVLEDAARRHAALQTHLMAISAEREASLRSLAAQAQDTERGGKAVLDEIDREIAALYARREKEAAETATALTQIEAQRQELNRQEERARQGLQNVVQALGGLISFFGGPPPPPLPQTGNT